MSEQKKELSKENKGFRTQLAKYTDLYLGMIQKQMQEGGATFDEYSGKCVLAAMGAINNMLITKGQSLLEINQSNLNEILIKVATLKLNANAVPRECYFQVRNVNVAPKGSKEDKWEKFIEFGIEGDGNDAILAKFGRGVKQVHQVWHVRSGDKFTYPKFNGLEMTAPQWEPTGSGDVVRVVYPIVKKDNTVEYYIGERRDVLKNLYAHISNNMMNETFGLVKGGKKTRYDATADEKKAIEAKKKELMKIAMDLGDIDEILDNETLSEFISPAWKDPQSREQMIIRKMRNNVVKKIPKDFDSAFTAEQYNMMDDTYREVHAEIEENANSVIFDVEYKEVPDEAPTEPAPQEEQKEDETAQNDGEPKTEITPELPDWMKEQ